MRTNETFVIKVDRGVIQKGKRPFHTKTAAEAISLANKLKHNPLEVNPNFSEEYVKYWKEQDYKIEKITTTIEQVASL